MIRETPIDPAERPEEVARVASLADLAWGPMDGEEAAAFLKTSRAGFDRIAPSLPRKKKRGLGYRYLRSELLAWLCSDDGGEGPTGRQPDGNAEPVGVRTSQKKRKNGGTVRLV